MSKEDDEYAARQNLANEAANSQNFATMLNRIKESYEDELKHNAE